MQAKMILESEIRMSGSSRLGSARSGSGPHEILLRYTMWYNLAKQSKAIKSYVLFSKVMIF